MDANNYTMNMNPPKQRRNRKKKDIPIDPQAAREEAELRMKIQQSLQTQYVDRASVEEHGANPLMMYGQMGICGVVGGQDGMNNNMGMNTAAMNDGMGIMQQQWMQQQQFNNPNYGMLTQDEMAQCMKNAEMKMYEMQLQQEKMILQQKMQQKITMEKMQQQAQLNMMRQQQGMAHHGQGGINSVEIMRELRLKQEQLLQMGAAQNHMEEMSRGMSSGSESQQYQRGFSNNQEFAEQSQDSSFFSGSESDIDLARKWYNHQKNVNQNMGRQNSGQSAHSQNNLVDLTGSPSPQPMQQRRDRMTSPINQRPAPAEMEAMMMEQRMMQEEMQMAQTSASQRALEIDAMLKQKMMQEFQMQQMKMAQSPSPHKTQQMTQSPSPQQVEAMMMQAVQMQNQQNQQSNQGNMAQAKSPARSREQLFSLLERLRSEETESGLESLLSLPTPGGGSIRDSLTLGDLQAWVALKNSKCGESVVGFHSVGNDMSASFSSVMGASMENLDEQLVIPGIAAYEGSVKHSPHQGSPGNTKRGSSFDLAPIAENALANQAGSGQKDRISLTVNDFKQGWAHEHEEAQRQPQKSKRAPSLGQTEKKESLTVVDLKQSNFSKSSMSGMSLSLGDLGDDLFDSNAQISFMQNSTMTHGMMPNPVKHNQSEMMMSMDSLTYSALMKVGNESNSSTGPICHDLSDVAEGDNESRTSTASNVDGQLRMSQASRASSSRSGRRLRQSSNDTRGPSIMSEISNWSASNPYGDDSNHNLNEEGNAGDQADDTDRQRSGSSVDVAELEALHDSVDFSL
jgi:hypothetical protein